MSLSPSEPFGRFDPAAAATAESGTKGGGCVNNAANVINMEQGRNETSDDATVSFRQTDFSRPIRTDLVAAEMIVGGTTCFAHEEAWKVLQMEVIALRNDNFLDA